MTQLRFIYYVDAAPRLFFFFNDTATTEIYTLSLHDALPICWETRWPCAERSPFRHRSMSGNRRSRPTDRKSTRLNSSHMSISYAVFCLKKKRTNTSRPVLEHAPTRSIAYVDAPPCRGGRLSR